jgi:hypothetical protein
MFVAINHIDFFTNGEFSIHRTKEEIPKEKSYIEITKPCYVYVAFDKFNSLNYSNFQINKYFEQNPSIEDIEKNVPPFVKREFEKLENGFKYIDTDTFGNKKYYRTIWFTQDFINQILN